MAAGSYAPGRCAPLLPASGAAPTLSTGPVVAHPIRRWLAMSCIDPFRRFLVAAIPLLLIPPGPLRAQEHEHAASEEEIGSVHFPTSCNEAAQARFDRGVAKLHSFWFDSANEEFAAAAAADPSCAMAHWGTAMTFWGNPMARTAPSAENTAEAMAAVA